MTADQWHERIRTAPTFAAAQDRLEAAVRAGVDPADLLDAQAAAAPQVPGAALAAAVAHVHSADARELPEPYPLTGECPGCGQQSAYSERCPGCRAEERKPQGSQDRLFTPTAAPIPGQLSI